MFQDCSHFFLIEEPERFLQTLLGWLERNTRA